MGIINFLKKLLTNEENSRKTSTDILNEKKSAEAVLNEKRRQEEKMSEEKPYGSGSQHNEDMSMKALFEERISKFFYKEQNLDYSDIDKVRLYLQQFNTRWNGGLYSLLFYHFKVSYKSKLGILLLYVDGKCVLTSENITLEEFSRKVQDYIFEKIDNFDSLSERDKTVHLLKHIGIKKVEFSSRIYSWISRPDFWILSKTSDFKSINNMILSLVFSREIYILCKYLPYMIFSVLDNHEIFVRSSNPYSAKLRYNDFEIFNNLKYYCKFYPEKLVVKRFLKSNYDEDREFPNWFNTNQKVVMIYKEYNIHKAVIKF